MIHEYTITDHLTDAQIDDLMRLYAPEFWTSRRTREDVVTMLRHTDLVFAAVDASGRLAGFARVLTDFVYRATLYDVIVDPSVRGGGVGRLLLDAVVNHPQLRAVEAIDLSCLPDKVELYQKWSFVTDLGGTLFMRRRQGPQTTNSV